MAENRNKAPGRAEGIARHAATRGSGRVGRRAAARARDPEAIRLAVIAPVRHEETGCDKPLMAGVSREAATDRVRASIDGVLSAWQEAR